MGINAFLRFDQVVGESRDSKYPNWIEIQGLDWEINSESSVATGTGASVGKAEPGPIKFKHYYDTASPSILNYIATGKHFKAVQISVRKNIGAAEPVPFFAIKCEDAYITSVSFSIDDEGRVEQDIEFVFKTIQISYKPQKNDGTLDALVGYGWDIAKNKVMTSADAFR